MKATIVDLRYHMKDILKALERNETVEISYRGKIKGTIIPNQEIKKTSVKDHPFYGARKKDKKSVTAIMKQLRGNRYADL